jgi:catechol 2,3-dioxygenase-like lactoylglutathione lyase family enzyme
VQELKPAGTLNHVAYPTDDTAATVRFYTELLGFRLVGAVEIEPDEPGRGPALHTFFETGGGECIAFFDIAGLSRPAPDGLPAWVRHIAFNVDSYDELMAWKGRLEGGGLPVAGPVDHEDGTWKSIYFQDPNEVTLEFTWQGRQLGAGDAAAAQEAVRRWVGGGDKSK